MGLFDDKVLGTPAISFKGQRRGFTVRGVLLPIPVLEGDKVVQRFVREYGATNRDGTPKVYPKSGDRITGYQFLIGTPFRAWEAVSAKYEDDQARDFPDAKDDGLRRWFAESAYAANAIKDARKRLGTVPEVGGEFSLKVTGLKTGTASDGSSWEAPDLEVSWTAADAAGGSVVEMYVASDAYVEPKPPTPVAASDDDPWGVDSDDPAPF